LERALLQAFFSVLGRRRGRLSLLGGYFAHVSPFICGSGRVVDCLAVRVQAARQGRVVIGAGLDDGPGKLGDGAVLRTGYIAEDPVRDGDVSSEALGKNASCLLDDRVAGVHIP
jgi:hypothetical protein